MQERNKKKLVVIGAGYAGVNFLKGFINSKEFDVTLIDKSEYHLHQTDIHKYISSQIDFDKIAFKLEPYCKKRGFNFVNSFVENIDFKSKKVLTQNEVITYDFLVIASGSRSFFPKQIKNIEKYSYDIKDIDYLKNCREKFLKLIDEKRANKNIAIIGAGLSGVEIALEFAHVLNEKNIKADELSISLIEQYKDVLPHMNPFLVDKTRKKCDKLGIKRYHNEFVTEVLDDKIILANNEKISYDMAIFVMGICSQKIAFDESIKLNVKNQFVLDDYLKVEGLDDVFVLGDIAQTKDKKGNFTQGTAQIAKLQAKLLVKNIKNLIKNKPLFKNNLEAKGVMIDLASKDTVGVVMGVKIKGKIAYNLKRYVSRSHMKLFK